jgi:hypothetical protein
MIPSNTVSGYPSGNHNKDDEVAVQFDRDGQWYRTFHTLTHSFHRSLGDSEGQRQGYRLFFSGTPLGPFYHRGAFSNFCDPSGVRMQHWSFSLWVDPSGVTENGI